jgi:hypothetical protein
MKRFFLTIGFLTSVFFALIICGILGLAPARGRTVTHPPFDTAKTKILAFIPFAYVIDSPISRRQFPKT